MNDTPCEAPIEELLDSVPIDERLQIEIGPTHRRIIPVGVHCKSAAATIRKLKAENVGLRKHVEELESKVSAARSRLQSDYVQLKTELVQAKAENARLLAMKHAMADELRRHVECGDCKLQAYFPSTCSNALRNLLAPTIELLSSMANSGIGEIPYGKLEKELTRLRSILTSNAKSDTNTP